MPLKELKYQLPGRIYASRMPFGTYDPEGKLMDEFEEKNISAVVLLASDDECQAKANRDLREIYNEKGYEVIYLPVTDFSIPTRSEIHDALSRTITLARDGRNIVIHCSAGVGRTGLFAVCLACKVFGIAAGEAVLWVRASIPGAVETDEQERFVADHCCREF